MADSAYDIVRPGAERFDEVVETLCEAFHDYPVMRFILKDAGADYDGRLIDLLGYFTDCRIARDWPVLGLEQDGRLQAVANLNPPQSAPAPPALERRWERLCERMGEAAVDRFARFAECTEPFRPTQSHYYLGTIGVRSACQGSGLGRILLDAVHRLSADDPESAGVVLTTETADNVKLYKHFGYRLMGQADVDELTSRLMFRPDTFQRF